MDWLKKNKNIVLTSVILVIALVIGIITGIQFYRFSNYNAYFFTDGADEIEKYSKYSPSLEGTVGDANIYIMHGKENTVAVVRSVDAEKYDSLEKVSQSGARLAGVLGSSQLSTAMAKLPALTFETRPSATEVVDALRNERVNVAILKYEDAKQALKDHNDLVIAKAEVEKVPSLLVLGGTHPNEPAGQLAATLFLENAKMKRGTLYVVTETNRSAYTHSQPQEASPFYYHLQTKSGKTRTFKFGSRATNTNQQWPKPDVYTHNPSGQPLSGNEVLNINRSYPGSINGTYTERVAYAVTECVRQNDITMVVDLHEAAPEYITINAMVAHDDAQNLAASAVLAMELYTGTTTDGEVIDGVSIRMEVSPANLHGLTHRELGDFTNTYAFLCETSNASQGKIRGKFTEDLIVSGEDKFYVKAEELGLLYAAPVNIKERVARHTLSILSIINAYNDEGKTRLGETTGSFELENIPSYVEIYDNGVGYYLHDEVK